MAGYVGTGRGGAVYQGGVGTLMDCVFIGNQALGGSNNTAGVGAILLGTGVAGALDNNFFGICPVSLVVSGCTFTITVLRAAWATRAESLPARELGAVL